jgi:hypothetical protein
MGRSMSRLHTQALRPYSLSLASAPIVRALEAKLAVRHDRYSDFGATTNPKVWKRSKDPSCQPRRSPRPELHALTVVIALIAQVVRVADLDWSPWFSTESLHSSRSGGNSE